MNNRVNIEDLPSQFPAAVFPQLEKEYDKFPYDNTLGVLFNECQCNLIAWLNFRIACKRMATQN